MRRSLVFASSLLIATVGVGGNAWAATTPSGSGSTAGKASARVVAGHESFSAGKKQILRLAPKSAQPLGRALPRVSQPRVLGPATAKINVTYIGFSAPAKTAFQAAVDIWQTQIHSAVPVDVVADWSDLTARYGDAGILGAAGPTDFVRSFTNAPNPNVFYPIALANAIAGSDLLPANGCDSDLSNVSGAEISASFNSASSIDGVNSAWYYGTDGNTPSNKVDLESVVLHELGHGLGFVGTFDGLDPSTGIDNGNGYYGLSSDGQNPTVFDTLASDGSGTPLMSYANGSLALGNVLRGGANGARWNGTNGVAANLGTRPLLYSPGPSSPSPHQTWEEGSSYSHLDETTYPAISGNALMTPGIEAGEVEHSPGPIMLGMFQDMGWPTSAPPVDSTVGQYHAVSPLPLPRLAVPAGSSDPLRRQATGVFGVPADASAVVVNVEIKAPTAKGYFATLPGCPFSPGRSDTGDYTAGQSRVAQATLPVDPSGAIRISPSAGSPSVNVDLVGWYGSGGTLYHHLQNQQVAALTTVHSTAPIDVPVAGHAGIPASGATAVVFKARVSASTSAAALVISPGGLNTQIPTQWFPAKEMISSFVTVPLGTGGSAGKVRLRLTAGTATVSLEAVGWYGMAVTGGQFFHQSGPVRYGQTLKGSEVTVGGLPVNAQVELDVHLANPSASGWLGSAPAGHTTLHGVQEYTAGRPVSGTIITTTNTAGQVRLHLSAGTSTMYVDWQGWFATT